jgi:hypothetical protein
MTETWDKQQTAVKMAVDFKLLAMLRIYLLAARLCEVYTNVTFNFEYS